MNRRLTSSACLFMLSVAGCAGRAGRAKATPEAAAVPGRYEFTVNLAGYQAVGHFLVLSDTIIVERSNQLCTPLQGPADFSMIRYSCSGFGDYDTVMLMLDRRNPVRLSKWSASRRVQAQRRVCAQYTTNSQGERVCGGFTMEAYEATERTDGPLRVKPVT
jgi:hypothetical protein